MQNNSIKVITWNILNPNPDIVKVLLQGIVNNSKKLAEIDYKRYIKYRKYNILKIIDKWFKKYKNNLIICLQEVCKDMYNELLAIYGNNRIKINTIVGTKDDYRCTLISEDLKFIKSYDIILQGDNVKKNALCTFVKTTNEIIIKCINLHLYYKWNHNLKKILKNILLDLKNPNENIIICGDFNKPFETIYDFINEPNKQLKAISINNKQFTSFNTRLKKIRNNKHYSMQVIDHIIIGNGFQFKNTPKIISKVNDLEIFYNLVKIENIVKTENGKTIENKWNSRIGKDISDHKPVSARIIFRSF